MFVSLQNPPIWPPFDLIMRCIQGWLSRMRDHSYSPQVLEETGQPEGTDLAFTGVLFQPVPWSIHTKKGMPVEYEKYASDSDYVIINTPPNFMFQVGLIPHEITSPVLEMVRIGVPSQDS